MPYKLFVAGEEALASDANSYFMSQSIPRFPSAAARDAAITAPVKNQLCILDTVGGELLFYDGTAWFPVGWQYSRFVHQLPALAVPPSTANAYEFPALTFPRKMTMMASLQCYLQASAAGNQSVNVDCIVNSVGAAPTTAPVSTQVMNPFAQLTFPLTALWRNVTAGVNCAPKVRFSVGTGAPTLTVTAISGVLMIMTPGLEF